MVIMVYIMSAMVRLKVFLTQSEVVMLRLSGCYPYIQGIVLNIRKLAFSGASYTPGGYVDGGLGVKPNAYPTQQSLYTRTHTRDYLSTGCVFSRLIIILNL